MAPCPIKNKYYPVVLLVLFSILGASGGLPIDIWLGFLLAHLMNRFIYISNCLEPSEKMSKKFEGFFMKYFNGKIGRVVPHGGGPSPAPPVNQNTRANNAPGKSTEDIVRSAFSGGGVRIGGTESNAVFTNYDHLDRPAQQPAPNHQELSNLPAPVVSQNKKDQTKSSNNDDSI